MKFKTLFAIFKKGVLRAMPLLIVFALFTTIHAAELLLDTAEDISVNTGSFNGVLDGTCIDVQAALDKIDDITTDKVPEGITNKYLNGNPFQGDVTGAYNSTVVGNDSHTHTSATVADEYLKNNGDVGNGAYTFTGNVTVGSGSGNPQLNFLGATNKYIYYDSARNALVINSGKVIIE